MGDGVPAGPDPADDPEAAFLAKLRKLNADPYAAQAGGGRGLTLATAIHQVEAVFPAAFYAPERWGTDDGCITFQALWEYVRAVPAILALQRMSLSRAVNIGMGCQEANSMANEDKAEAFPA